MTKNRIAFVLLLLSALHAGAVFQVNKDGFSFPNYGNDRNPQNLTPATMQHLCGSESCARGSGSSCVLSASARELMNNYNEDMGNGHCDGIASVAELLRTGQVPHSRYDTRARVTYDVRKSKGLESDIAYYWTTQLTEPTVSSKLRKITPNQMVSTLRNPGREIYTIHMFNAGYKNGHAVTFVNVVNRSADQVQVEIYDNNFPNSKRFITVYPKSNTWTYPGYKLHGGVEKKILNLVPLSARLRQQSCPVASNNDRRPQRPISRPQPQPQPQFEDEDDEEEYDDTDYEEEYDDQDYQAGPQLQLNNGGFNLGDGIKLLSSIVEMFAGSSMRVTPVTDSKASSIYSFPANKDRHFQLIADDLRTKEPTELRVTSKGSVMVIEGLRPHKGQKDDVFVSADSQTVGYSTKFSEPVVLLVAETYEGADYELRIRPVMSTKGYDLRVHNAVDTQWGNHELELQLKNHDGSPAHYSIEITRIGEKQDDKYKHSSSDLVIMANEVDRIAYGKWIRDKQPLEVRDVIDGRVTKSQLMRDED